MQRLAVAAALLFLALAAPSAHGGPGPPTPWDGANPFACELQYAGAGAQVPDPDADPLCIEYDKRSQNVTGLGVVEFLSLEPARVALASDKCFYFQSDRWRGSVVQEDGTTKTYEWDGHYFFDRATGDGGTWVTGFNVGGHTADPTALPGFPPEWGPYFGEGTGGFVSRNGVPVEPRCAAKAEAESPYATPSWSGRPAKCSKASGGVGARRVGPLRIGMPESRVWARLGRPKAVERGFLRYCLLGRGGLMAGVPGDRSGTADGPGGSRVRFLVATHRALTIRGVGRGDRSREVRRAFPRARTWFVMGRTRVVRVRGTVMLAVRGGRVRAVAVRDARRVRSASAARDWLRRALRPK